MTPWEEDAINLKRSGLSRCPVDGVVKKTKTLSLPSVTLLCVDCLYLGRSTSAIDRCLEMCDFGAVKFLTNIATEYPYKVAIDPLPTLCDYSIFMLKRAHEFVSTSHCLVVQHDGFILNPEVWDPGWLQYDYLAPLFDQVDMVGSGGFSLRSRLMMEHISNLLPPWDGTREGTDRLQKHVGSYEDGVISVLLRQPLLSAGFKFASNGEAIKFAQGGNRNPSNYVARPFGFHRPDPRKIDHDTGVIEPPL